MLKKQGSGRRSTEGDIKERQEVSNLALIWRPGIAFAGFGCKCLNLHLSQAKYLSSALLGACLKSFTRPFSCQKTIRPRPPSLDAAKWNLVRHVVGVCGLVVSRCSFTQFCLDLECLSK
eukprot:s206_g6.t1